MNFLFAITPVNAERGFKPSYRSDGWNTKEQGWIWYRSFGWWMFDIQLNNEEG